MTDLQDSTEKIDSIEPEAGGDDPPPQSDSRFSPLFVGLIFVAALFLGAAIGYGFGRSQSQPPGQVVVVTATSARPAQQAEQAEAATGEATPTIMDFVLSDARHFQGSADAPITMIEFSDFK
jgi:protein-disulfide isomerase